MPIDDETPDFSEIDKLENEDAGKIAASKPNNNPSEENSSLMDDEVVLLKNASSDKKQIQSGQGPLDNPVIERSYTERQYQGDTMTPIPEPQNVRETINANQVSQPTPPDPQKVKQDVAQQHFQDQKYATDVLGEKEQPRTGGNPATSTMSKKEREQNLEMTVTSAIDGYIKLKSWLAGWLTTSDSKLIKRSQAGKTPPDWAVLYDSHTGEVMTLRELVLETNKRIEQAGQTDADFVAKIRPILTAEFDRRNWIYSPQQNGAFIIGSDLLNMGQKLFAINMNLRQIMAKSDKEFEEAKAGGFLSAREVYNNNKNFARNNYQPQQNQVFPDPAPQQQASAATTNQTTVTNQQNSANAQVSQPATVENKPAVITKPTVSENVEEFVIPED